ncbi:MAG: hypothetical protein IJU19_05050 [Bacteroidales bacterium]|nr:hypothetical protein [Bacteroidales bacterium]
MKNIALLTLGVALLYLATGCSKDGKYSPKEKINKVYSKTSTVVSHQEEGVWQVDTSITVGKHLAEQWYWDGSKLAAIAYYNAQGRVASTVRFNYDGSQLTRAYTDDRNYITFSYDGRKATAATEVVNGQRRALYQFSHDGSKISKIEIHFSSIAKGGERAAEAVGLNRTFWGLLMPCDANVVQPSAGEIGTKSAQSIVVSLSWDGKNVSKATVENGNVSYATAYSYDDNHNPYQSFLYALINGGETSPLSKNNVTSATITNADGSQETTSYSYAYDGSWPIARGAGRRITSGGYATTETETLYFEYDD